MHMKLHIKDKEKSRYLERELVHFSLQVTGYHLGKSRQELKQELKAGTLKKHHLLPLKKAHA